MERNWDSKGRPLASSFELQARLCTTDITKEMGSSEVAIATPGSGWGLAKRGRKGKGKSRAQEHLVNANQKKQGSLPGPCPGLSSVHQQLLPLPSPH